MKVPIPVPIRIAFVAALLGGCSVERHWIRSPGTSQTIRVESGDRFYMTLEENSTTGYRWSAVCDDSDVDVKIEHVPGKEVEDGMVGVPGSADVEIRVHRGYDGPSNITFSYKRPWESEPIRKFTISLFKRTGYPAFWQ